MSTSLDIVALIVVVVVVALIGVVATAVITRAETVEILRAALADKDKGGM